MSKLLEVKGLNFTINNKRLLNNINLEIIKDQNITICGKSGSGKSVLLKNMIGLLQPSSGTIIYQGERIDNISFNKKRKFLEHCGLVLQSGALFDSLTIEQNINFFKNKGINSTNNDKEYAIENLKLVGLDKNILNSYPSELSGGMYKRVALARAIAHKPQILFLDEPTTGLDPIITKIITNLILDLTNKLKMTLVTITHDIKIAQIISEKITFISEGNILWQGDKKNLNETNFEEIREFIFN